MKYKIDKQYGIYAHFSSPFHPLIFPFASFLLGLIPKMLKGDKDVKIIKKKINHVPIYIFEPIQKTDKIILFIHGGGFVYKGYSSHFDLCKTFAKRCHCKVIYVDYRLAPKYKYPIPLNDCLLVYKWILENDKELNIDKNKIVVAGDSAGGNLACDLTFKTIENNMIKPCFVMLLYPVLDQRMNTESMKTYIDTPMWNSKKNQKMWNYYLEKQNYISPNERDDLTKFPNTYIETAEFDCLHDEGVEFASKLKNCGVHVFLNETKGTMHGYDIKKCKITSEAVEKRIEVLKQSCF